MAINTRNRRASCIGFCFPPCGVPPVPDSSLADQRDRQQTAFTYAGLLAASTIVIAVSFCINEVQLYFAGYQEIHTYRAGEESLESFTAGSVELQTSCY